MEALVLDSNFKVVAVLDEYTSLLWTDRFFEYGVYEVTLPASALAKEHLVEGNYLWCKNSDKLMMIESIQYKSTFEHGDLFVSSGRSIEAILSRRVIWNPTTLEGNFQNGIQKLLNENAISPSDSARKIPYLTFVASTDSQITSLTYEGQFYGENLYDTIATMCKAKNIGWRIYPDIDNNLWKFELLTGIDYSYSQSDRPWVVFSEDYENISDSNYVYSRADYKTVTLVSYETQNTDSNGNKTTTRWTEEVYRDDGDPGSGLERRELFVTSNGSPDTEIKNENQREQTYRNEMKQQGKDELAATDTISAFDGVIESTKQFVYGKDFKLGDIVQIVNRYGMEAATRVVEVAQSQDENGYKIVPTFTSMDDLNNVEE